jgi:hypothetical protein
MSKLENKSLINLRYLTMELLDPLVITVLYNSGRDDGLNLTQIRYDISKIFENEKKRFKELSDVQNSFLPMNILHPLINRHLDKEQLLSKWIEGPKSTGSRSYKLKDDFDIKDFSNEIEKLIVALDCIQKHLKSLNLKKGK